MKNTSEKHINIVSFEIPYPANYGGVIDVFYKMKALVERGYKVHLHCFEYGREHSDLLEKMCYSVSYYKRLTRFSKVLHTLPYIVCSRDSQELLENLKKNDYPILLEGLHSCMILSDESMKDRKIFVRTHNVEHEYYQYLAKTEKNLQKKLFFLQESSKLLRFEPILQKATGVLAISQNDYDYFAKLYDNVSLITAYNAFDTVNIVEGQGDYVLYHGKLDISENYNAAEFLINVFKGTDIKLKIAGMNPPKHLIHCAEHEPNVELIDSPDDDTILSLIQNAQVNILVTAQSTGLKLKLLNALFNGRYCVVNDKMVDGLNVNDLCIVANDAESIKETVSKLMSQPFDAAQVALRNSRMKEFYNLQATTDKLVSLIG